MAIHVKGMELPGYDPRGTIGYSLAYSVADRGGCHRRARPVMAESKSEALRFSYQGKAQAVKSQEDGRGYDHSLVLCDYVPTFFEMSSADLALLMTDLTGVEFTAEKLDRVGERAINLARLFNNRCGITNLDDTLPGRFFSEVLPRGASAGKTVDPAGLESMVQEYYALRGWDVNGQVPEATLHALGIE
jgi:aldehyde:ferredoxin oxidoreductase